MIVIVMLLSVVCTVMATKLFLQSKGIEHLAKTLKEIKGEGTNKKLTLDSPNKVLQELIIEMNKVIEDKREENINHIKKEEELRRQIANISHDLRTPLTSILGYLELINDSETSEDERKEYLKIIEARSKVLQTLITSFYDLSRIEANEYQLELSNININNLLTEILVTYYSNFKAKGMEVSIDLKDSEKTIIADKKSVTRIYSNLIQNALNHGIEKLEVIQRVEDGELVTYFKNKVEGFNDEDITKVFERFYTKDKMRTGENTGLGLTITKKLVELMGYKIQAVIDKDIFTIKIIWKS